MEKLLKVKEAQICESETKAKELSLRAEEFEELFNGQLASVKALQSDLSVASNENKALVKEMEMLNQMFNAMEKHYVNQALTEYKAQVRRKLSLSSFTFFRTKKLLFLTHFQKNIFSACKRLFLHLYSINTFCICKG